MGREHERPVTGAQSGRKASGSSFVPTRGEKWLHVKVGKAAGFTEALFDGSSLHPVPAHKSTVVAHLCLQGQRSPSLLLPSLKLPPLPTLTLMHAQARPCTYRLARWTKRRGGRDAREASGAAHMWHRGTHQQVVPLTCDARKQGVPLTCDTDRERSKPVPLTPEPDLDDAFLFRLKPGDNEPLSSLASRLHIVVVKQVRAQDWCFGTLPYTPWPCSLRTTILARPLSVPHTSTLFFIHASLHPATLIGTFVYTRIHKPCHIHTLIDGCMHTYQHTWMHAGFRMHACMRV
jgi:hypothetical protein